MPRSVNEGDDQRRRSRSICSSSKYNREHSGKNRHDIGRSSRSRSPRMAKEPSKLPSLLTDIDRRGRPRAASKDKVENAERSKDRKDVGRNAAERATQVKKEYPRRRRRNPPRRRTSNIPYRRSHDERKRATRTESSRYNSDGRSQRGSSYTSTNKHHSITNINKYPEIKNKSRADSQNDRIGPSTILMPETSNNGHEINQGQYIHALNKEIENIRHGGSRNRRSSEGTSKRLLESSSGDHYNITNRGPNDMEKIGTVSTVYETTNYAENRNLGSTAQPKPPCIGNANHNCEVLIFDNKQRRYAGEVVRLLDKTGINASLEVVPAGISAMEAVDNSSRKGLPFVVTIFGQNEAKRSVTLNILTGTPQEHRNMPLESALKLAKETYIQYTSFIRDRSNRSSTNVTALQSSTQSPDRKIKQLFALVSENRDISMNEIHIMRTYLNNLENKLLAKQISSTATNCESSKYEHQNNEICEKISSGPDWCANKDVLLERGSTGAPTPNMDIRSYMNRISDIGSIVKEQIHSRSNTACSDKLETPGRREAESLFDSNTNPNNTEWSVQSNDKPATDSTSQFPFAYANSRNLTSSDPANCYHHAIKTNLSQTLIPSHDANTGLSYSALRTLENRTMDDPLITSSDLPTVKSRSDNYSNNMFRTSDNGGTYDGRSISWIPRP